MHRTHAGHGSIWPAETSGKPAEARASDQSTLTAERIAELRELLAKATPLPWKWWTSNSWRRLRHDDRGRTVSVIEPTIQGDDHPDCIVSQDDMSLMDAAFEILPALIDAAERAEKNLQHAAIMHAERDMAIESASRAREDALREAARVAESLETLEAWLPTGPNGEGKDRHATSHGAKIAAAILALIDKPKGGDRG